ncbi:hypothetical protein [Mucilaginibacter phyllosphaerae]
MTHAIFIMEPNYEEVLSQPVSELNLSKESICYLERLNTKTLCDFICKGWSYYNESEQADSRCFNEVISFLRERKLLHLMEGL